MSELPKRTRYEEIVNRFLLMIQDYNLLEIPQAQAEDNIKMLFDDAVGDLQDLVLNISGIDLLDYDDEQEVFNAQLPRPVIKLIVLTMVRNWFTPFLLNTEHMHNILNTKDFNQYSPGNFLNRLRELDEDLGNKIRRERSWYSQRFGYLRDSME